MPFHDFPRSPLDIVAPDGTVRASTEGIVASSSLVVIFDTAVHIEPGDELRRTLPNGYQETFEVRDSVFQQGMGGIPSFYDVKVARKGSFPRGTGGHYIQVTGPNARVNLNSTDNSVNTVLQESVFGELRSAIEAGVSNLAERERLTEALGQFERSKTKGDKLDAYQRLIAAGANHMTILSPFLGALSGLVS